MLQLHMGNWLSYHLLFRSKLEMDLLEDLRKLLSNTFNKRLWIIYWNKHEALDVFFDQVELCPMLGIFF